MKSNASKTVKDTCSNGARSIEILVLPLSRQMIKYHYILFLLLYTIIFYWKLIGPETGQFRCSAAT